MCRLKRLSMKVRMPGCNGLYVIQGYGLHHDKTVVGGCLAWQHQTPAVLRPVRLTHPCSLGFCWVLGVCAPRPLLQRNPLVKFGFLMLCGSLGQGMRSCRSVWWSHVCRGRA